jgi:hypothetical protein
LIHWLPPHHALIDRGDALSIIALTGALGIWALSARPLLIATSGQRTCGIGTPDPVVPGSGFKLSELER